MRKKPAVCLVDEEKQVQDSWRACLGSEANLVVFDNPNLLIEALIRDSGLAQEIQCVVMAKSYPSQGIEILESITPFEIKTLFNGPILLNFQGYVEKEPFEQRFHGKLFHRFGVRWQTLRIRIQKMMAPEDPLADAPAVPKPHKVKHKKIYSGAELLALSETSPVEILETSPGPQFPHNRQLQMNYTGVSSKGTILSKSARCSSLLRHMALNATGAHRQRIEYYMQHDLNLGEKLLEAIYQRLVSENQISDSCPSQYIHTSPVIAKRMLRDALLENSV